MLTSYLDRKDGPYAGHGIIPPVAEIWSVVEEAKATRTMTMNTCLNIGQWAYLEFFFFFFFFFWLQNGNRDCYLSADVIWHVHIPYIQID